MKTLPYSAKILFINNNRILACCYLSKITSNKIYILNIFGFEGVTFDSGKL